MYSQYCYPPHSHSYSHSQWYQSHGQPAAHYSPHHGVAMPGPCQHPALSDPAGAKAQIESLLHISNPWPDCHDQLTIQHLCRSE